MAALAESKGGLTPWAGVFIYPSKGRRYARWMRGSGVRCSVSLHICGGSADKPIVRSRVRQIETWLADGVPHEIIEQAIRSWR